MPARQIHLPWQRVDQLLSDTLDGKSQLAVLRELTKLRTTMGLPLWTPGAGMAPLWLNLEEKGPQGFNPSCLGAMARWSLGTEEDEADLPSLMVHTPLVDRPHAAMALLSPLGQRLEMLSRPAVTPMTIDLHRALRVQQFSERQMQPQEQWTSLWSQVPVSPRRQALRLGVGSANTFLSPGVTVVMGQSGQGKSSFRDLLALSLREEVEIIPWGEPDEEVEDHGTADLSRRLTRALNTSKRVLIVDSIKHWLLGKDNLGEGGLSQSFLKDLTALSSPLARAGKLLLLLLNPLTAKNLDALMLSIEGSATGFVAIAEPGRARLRSRRFRGRGERVLALPARDEAIGFQWITINPEGI